MRFIREKSGATAVVIAVMFPPLLMCAGGALDASYAITLRSELSHITKLACTRLSTSASRAATPTEQAALTGATIDAQLQESRLDPTKTAFTFTPASGGTAQVEGRSIYQTRMMQIFGYEEIGITASETCDFTLRVPTAAPRDEPGGGQCPNTVPGYNIPGNSAETTLADAQLRWRIHNEVCYWPYRTVARWSVNEGSAGFPRIVHYRRDRAELWCQLGPTPTEILLGVVSQNGDQVFARDLLSNNTQRGKLSVSYDDLPPGGELVLQAENGSPAILQEACYNAPPKPAYPPQPPDRVFRLPAGPPDIPPEPMSPPWYQPPYAGVPEPLPEPLHPGDPSVSTGVYRPTSGPMAPEPEPAPTYAALNPPSIPTSTPVATPPVTTVTPTPTPTPVPTSSGSSASASSSVSATSTSQSPTASNPCSGSSGGVSQTATTRTTSGGTASVSGSVSGGGGCGGTNSSTLNQTTRNGRTNGNVTATNGTQTSNSSINNAGNSGTQSGSANANNVSTHAHGAPADTFNNVDAWW